MDKEVCTGCGKCVQTCPQSILALRSFEAPVEVSCSSHDKGAVARKLCKNACIGCGMCMRNCPHSAIQLENNLAVVDSAICREKCTEATCLAKCPTKAIKSIVGMPSMQKTA